MFNVTGGEVVIIILAALVVLGPEKLPDVVRRAGRLYGELRRMSDGFQSELRSALDEPTRELRETAEMAKSSFSGVVDTVKTAVHPTSAITSLVKGSDHSNGSEAPPAVAPAEQTAAAADAPPAQRWSTDPDEPARAVAASVATAAPLAAPLPPPHAALRAPPEVFAAPAAVAAPPAALPPPLPAPAPPSPPAPEGP